MNKMDIEIVKKGPIKRIYSGTVAYDKPITMSRTSKTFTLLPTTSGLYPLIRKAVSIQPTEPRIWTTPITSRAISAPVAPTALGRTSNIMSAVTLGGGAVAPASSSSGGGISDSISNIESCISDIIQKYMPIAIKVVIAIVAIKVLWWLLRGSKK